MIWDPDDLVGRTIGDYRLLSILGRGAAGTVFLSEGIADPTDKAAVKVLMPAGQIPAEARAEFSKRFLQEARVLQTLRHPHILSLRAYGQDATTGLDYMVLPYIDGGTLDTRMAAGALSIAEAAAITMQVGDALDYAHAHSVIHRDIKPANILLDKQGQVYLADFGIARLFDTGQTTMTTSGHFMGTPAYMSPEQIVNPHVGASTDIYSLGMVLYHMVTGILPFQGNSFADLLMQVMQKVPASPRVVRPDLTKPGEAVIMRSLAKKPTERFASAGAMARAFDLSRSNQWAAGLVPYDPIPAGVGNSAKFVGTGGATTESRRPRRTGAVLLLTLLVIGGLLITLWGRYNNQHSLSPAGLGTVLAGAAGGTPTPKGNANATATPTSPGNVGGVIPPTDTPTATSTPLPPGVPTPTPTLIPTATDTPQPTATFTPQPTPTPTQCPFLNGGAGVTFYNGQNFSGQSYNVFFNPGQDVHFNLPNFIAGNLQSLRIDRAAWHVVTFNNPNSSGNLAHWDNDIPVMADGPGYKNSASAEVYLRRSC